MKHILVIITLFTLASCSSIGSMIDTVSKNPVLVNIATNQAVVRYISSADTLEQKQDRAQDFTGRATRVLEFVTGNPETNTVDVMSFIDSAIDWDNLEPADKFLITDILSLVEVELRKHELAGDTIALRRLLSVAISAAGVYL